MTTTKSGSSVPAYCIEFIYKNDAGGAFLSLCKKISYPRCTNAHKHFYKIASANDKKRDACFSGNCFCK